MSMNTVEELWKTVYDAFEKNANHGMEVIFATQQERKGMQFKLLNAVAELRRTSRPSDELLSTIHGDIMVAQTAGWMTPDTADRALELLDMVNGGIQRG